MIKDITIGQYFSGDSAIHKLEPRTKLLLTFFYIVLIFLCKNFYALLLVTLSLAIAIGISKIPFKTIIRGIKPIVIIIFFTSILNIFYNVNGKMLFEWKFLHITTGGIYTALFFVIRIIILIIASSLLTYTTSPTMITDGIERLFSFLKFMKNGVHTFAMMMTIALRFIPILVEEFEKISNAQKARGASFDSGGLVNRAKAMLPILIPLFFTSFRRAIDLAFAMECRCYKGGEGRTHYKRTNMMARDLMSMLTMLFLSIGVVLINEIFPRVI